VAKKKSKTSGGKEKVLNVVRSRGARYALWGVLFALVVVGIVIAGTQTWAAVTHRDEFQLGPDSLVIRSWPPCIRTDRMLQELRTQTRRAMSEGSVFDKDVCQRVQHELRGCPWVEDVKEVRRELPNRIVADVAFRQPAGVAKVGEKHFMIDEDGAWLPTWFYFKPEHWEAAPLPAITNDHLAHHPQPGRKVDALSLAVGARLSAFLLDQGLFQQVKVNKIDVTHVGRGATEPDVILLTEAGVAIKWGTTDAYTALRGLDRPAQENTDEQKLHMLQTKLDEYPGLKGLEYIDLRFNKIFFRPSAGL